MKIESRDQSMEIGEREDGFDGNISDVERYEVKELHSSSSK